jgi:hypothetical protein
MRTTIWIAIATLFFVPACKGSSKSAEEQAKKQAEELDKAKTSPQPAQKMRAPVTNEAHIPCEQLIPDPTAYQTALGETDPVTIADETKTDADAAAVCAIMKGGEKLDAKAQEKIAKETNKRLGVLPGDRICKVTAYCWTVETEENFKKRCAEKGLQDDQSMGSYSCVQVVITGEKDVNVHSFFDEDTKCILKVNAGPSNTDNDKIRTCAQVARDTIGPDQIRVDAPPPPQ